MSKTILANVDGFTPLIDSLSKEIGVIGAAVFGRMWRYCQMENGICHASLTTIASELGVSIRTVIRYSDELVTLGYLKDLTPDLRNKPHMYADTGKAGLVISVTGMTKSHSDNLAECYDTESQCYDRKSQHAMTESQLKIEDKKEYKKESKKRSEPKPRKPKPSKETCPQEWMTALYSLTRVNPSVATVETRSNLSTFGKALIRDGASLDALKVFEANWYKSDWRGQKGQAPTVKQLRDEWGKYSTGQNLNGHKTTVEYTDEDYAMAALINAAQPVGGQATRGA